MSSDLLARAAARPRGTATRHPVRLTAAAALSFAIAYLVAPPMGRDLAAQVARGDFWARHGAAVLDFGWYGGFSPYGYSLLTPAPMAWLGAGIDGPRRLGAIAGVLAAVAFAELLRRTGARRPLAGGLLGAVGIFGNLVSGRVTFTVGLAFGLAALLPLAATPGGRPWLRWVAAALGAALASAASPVAGLFTGLCGAALVLAVNRVGSPDGAAAVRRRGDLAGGLALGIGAGVPLVVTAVLFGVNGPMNVIGSDTLRSATVSALVALAVDRRVVRVGALLSLAGVLAAAVLRTPVGLNAGRLSATFALGVLAGYATIPHGLAARISRGLAARISRSQAAHISRGLAARISRGATAGVARHWRPVATAIPLVAVALWQHPVAVDELRAAGNPMARPAYVRPLLAELSRLGPVGRVEIPPTEAYWEAAYVPAAVPLARGWLRQADVARDPVFFAGRLTAPGYERWLRNTGVSYVAVAALPASSPGRAEARLIRTGLPYLARVWRNRNWTLYAVQGRPSPVTGATLVRSSDAGLTLDAATAGDVLVRVPWSRWLDDHGPAACVAPGPSGWTILRVRTPGRYTIDSALRPRARC